MFERLEDEIKVIKTPHFHELEQLSSKQMTLRKLPDAHLAFLQRFGGARLYRMLGFYLVGVYAKPAEEKYEETGTLLKFGHCDGVKAFYRCDQLRSGDAIVFRWLNKKLVKIADSFECWLEKSCKHARGRFSKKEWQKIIDGPEPFSAMELKIVSARRLFDWNMVGVNDAGAIKFRVRNCSDMKLPYLSIDIRSRSDENFRGGIWLPVNHIAPGTEAVVEKKCYSGLLDAKDIIAFDQPDPGPEDRERYWEFRTVGVKNDREGRRDSGSGRNSSRSRPKGTI
jgi:hypothetical protein